METKHVFFAFAGFVFLLMFISPTPSIIKNEYIGSNGTTNFTETDPYWSANSTSVSRNGVCPSGQYVQNTTSSGVQCTPAIAGVEIDPNWASNESRVTALESNKLNITDQRYNDTTLIDTKLNITDQRYNDTTLIDTKLNITDQRYNDTTLIDTKLNITDQRYNDSAKENVITFSTGLSRSVDTVTLKNPAAGEIGGVKSLTCGGTDKLSAIGTDGLPVCSADSTGGSGTSFTEYSYLSADVASTSSTVWTTITGLTLPLTTGKKVIIDCDLIVDTGAAATGIRTQINYTGTSSRRALMVYYTSAVAEAVCASTAASTQCLGASSAGAVVTPYIIRGYSVQSSGGFFTIDLQSETGTAVTVRAGSYCRSVEK